MSADPISVSAVAIAAGIGLCVKIVWDWLKNRNQITPQTCPYGFSKRDFEELKNNINWVKEIHDRYDANGVPLWYVPRTWKTDLDNIDDMTKDLNRTLNSIKDCMKEQTVILREILKKGYKYEL